MSLIQRHHQMQTVSVCKMISLIILPVSMNKKWTEILNIRTVSRTFKHKGSKEAK